MTDLDKKKIIKEFITRWKDKGYEKGESQKFWLDLLKSIFNIDNPTEFISFEDKVHIDKNSAFIDAFIPSTKVLIEQKSINKDLRKAIKQSDGSLLNPFQQAKRYSAELPYDDRPRWIITCNFKSFLVYDMNNPNGEPEEILLKDLAKEYYRLEFLVNTKSDHIKKEEQVSFEAGEIVGILYDAFSKQYIDLTKESSHQSLNELCVRLVFCLYAEDAGLFGRRNVFHDYLAKYTDLDQMRKALIELFKILDTPINERDEYLEDDLNQFPYVNGGLFSNENIEIPRFTEEIRETILAKASDEFDWSEISPTIFGAVFESTLNPETRRAGGMHYTSIENIHKVIDPLFLDDLRKELDEALAYKNKKTRDEALNKFQEHIGSLNFLDPACGSGNFLTETYLSLRRMENEAISAKQGNEITFDLGDVIKVHIDQFYGIEINDFAVKVATTALWIAESQMLKETEEILSRELRYFPLKTYTNIKEGNALRMDWNDVIPNTKCNYIMGNPPFVGHQYRNKEQQKDMINIFSDNKHGGRLDYVCCWYKMACEYITKQTKCGFVSTSSICQGEHVSNLWGDLLNNYNININFAYRSFQWSSESNKNANVWCVILGFSHVKEKYCKLYSESNQLKIVNNINPYLIEGENIIVKDRITIPPSGKLKMLEGSKPWDGGNLILSEKEKKELVERYPNVSSFIKEFVGGKELLNGTIRYCLWLKNVNPKEYQNVSEIRRRLLNVKIIREQTKTKATKAYAKYPYLFVQDRQPDTDFLAFPEINSINRKYLPIKLFSDSTIVSNLLLTLPTQNLVTFGILSSNVHMSWIKVLCGRLGNGMRYSPAIYYNFPWPTPSKEQKETIEKTAQLILDVRAKYPDSSLADLYDELTMPSDLRRAHQMNDKAVMKAYGFSTKMTESECVAELMKMYQELTEKEKKQDS